MQHMSYSKISNIAANSLYVRGHLHNLKKLKQIPELEFGS